MLLAILSSSCIDLAIPPRTLDGGACSAEMRAGFLNSEPGSERVDLWVAFVDVGHGDATWLRTPGTVGIDAGEILIDAGDDGRPVAPHVPDGGRAVLGLMQRAGLLPGDPLLALLITHPDKDHYGGAAAVLASHPARMVIHGGRVPSGPTWRRLREVAQQIGAQWLSAPDLADGAAEVDPWAALAWGAGVEVGLLASDRYAELDNDASLVVEIRFRGRRMLLMGDAGAAVEARLGDRATSVDILRTGHHGGQGTSGAGFLNRVLTRSSHAIISAGLRDGLPHEAVVDALSRRLETPLWRTDRADDGLTRRAAAGDDHIIARVSGDDGRVDVCFLDPDPVLAVRGADP